VRKIMNFTKLLVAAILAFALLFTVACGAQAAGEDKDTTNQGATQATTKEETKTAGLSGKIVIDGSSTVYPISAAMAEEFNIKNPDVEISVALAGTGGGMKKFHAGEIDICDASRKIKQEEIDKCKEKGIEYVELMIAYDGISIVVNKDNPVDSITVDELRKIWMKDSTIRKWNEVNPAWPDAEIKLYGPGADSGTFEFFTEKINGKAKEQNTNYTPSEDDNVLVQGVAGDKSAMGYFGFAYYEENMDKLKVLKIDGKEPSFESIKDLSYKPLSRPLFLYVNKAKLAEPQVKEFIRFYMDNAPVIVEEVKYVPLADYSAELAKMN
jgi:phosphate transport system substrate-binding protein